MSNLDKLVKISYLINKYTMKPITGLRNYLKHAKSKGQNTYRSYPFWHRFITKHLDEEGRERLGIYATCGKTNIGYTFTKPVTEIRDDFYEWLKTHYQKEISKKIRSIKKVR